MILSDTEMRRRMSMRKDRIVIEPEPPDDCIQPASIDLHLHHEVLVQRGPQIAQAISMDDPPIYRVVRIDKAELGGGYRLGPGAFVLGSTTERVEVPESLAARVEGKSTLGRLGLIVHVTAGFIDPGFRGNITLELKNVNQYPIWLESGMKISQICFMPVVGPVERPYGTEGLGSHYQDSEGTLGVGGRRE